MKSALVVPYRYLGDTLLATPLAKALKQAGYRVEWLVHGSSAQILERQPCADAVHVLQDNTLSMVRTLWNRFDEAFVVNGTDRLTGIARLAARRVYTTLTPERNSDAWKRAVVTKWQPFQVSAHTIDYVQGLAHMAAVPPVWHAGLEWQAEDAALALSLATVLPGKYIQLHPFARLRYKYWPDSCWLELMETILAHGLEVVVTGSNADQKQAEAIFLINGERQGVHLCCGSLNWRQLAALSAQAAAYIGVDTANTHLAAGSGGPVIALFGPTDPRLWGPWPATYQGKNPWQAASATGIQRQGNVSLLQGTMPCVPCQQEGCGQQTESSSDCLNSMETARVWAVCRERMNEQGHY